MLLPLVAFSVILAAWVLLDVQTEVRIEPQHLFTLPWGMADDGVNRAEARGRVFGPRSFAVDDHHIYIADTFNSRILVMNMDGTMAASWSLTGIPLAQSTAVDSRVQVVLPGAVLVSGGAAAAAAGDDATGADTGVNLAPWINDIAVGPDGKVYLADAARPRILVMNPDGSLDRTVDLSVTAPGDDPAGDAVWLVERLLVDEDGIVYLTHAYLSDAALTRRVTRFQETAGKFAHISSVTIRPEGGPQLDAESLLPVPANSFVLGANGHLYVESAGTSPFTRVIRAYDDKVRLAHSWKVTWPRLISGASLVGVDRRNWVYLALGTGQPEGQILLLAPEQGTLYEAGVNWQDGFEVNVYARLHDDAVFIARPQAEGFTLEKWPVQRLRKISLAGLRAR